MSTNLFTVFIMTLTMSLTVFYGRLREHFSPLDAYKERVVHLEDRIERERLKRLLTSYEFADFRGYVATLLPEAIRQKGPGEKSYPLRSLASVVQNRWNEKYEITTAREIFEQGKKSFREKKYEDAEKTFKSLWNNHPLSPYIPETLFLLVESTYALGRHEQSIEFANKMLELYPDLELTGYALLRLGRIYESKERMSDAASVYNTVLKSFQNQDLTKSAYSRLREVAL